MPFEHLSLDRWWSTRNTADGRSGIIPAIEMTAFSPGRFWNARLFNRCVMKRATMLLFEKNLIRGEAHFAE
jgi:hypothetical protein